MPKIAKVVVEIALDREFDYTIPDEWLDVIRVGSPVTVPFGHSATRGYVVGLSDTSDRRDLKPIKNPVGDKSLINDEIMRLARWISDYYVAPIESAVRTILPSAVRRRGARHREQLSVVPTPAATDEQAVSELRKRAPRQAAVLDVLQAETDVLLNQLVKSVKTTAATVRALEDKGFVRIGRRAVLRDPLKGMRMLRTEPLELMPQQHEALKVVKRSMDTLTPPVVLLHGVTGSGKTEIYLQAIQYALSRGRGAIVLVPEISLTPQTVERFHGRFGDTIAVLHSHLSTGERHDEWHRIHEGKARIVIGARSALFAPVHDPGLIVVDEEHEQTYKQEEAPRYNARDVAVMRGRMDRCSVLLGSATPSLESYQNVRSEKYGIVHMHHRVDHRRMPAVRVVDLRLEAEREGRINVLSRDLVEAIDHRLRRGEQVMLFLNRRGFASSMICVKCGHVTECVDCSVSMTYHKQAHVLRCHICGRARAVPERCPNPECRDPAFKMAGIGTQRVEEVVSKVFPKASVRRMDSDSTSRKSSHQEILGEFREGGIDILIGTQMIAKGLHFPNVTLVGVIYADTTLHMPDYRAGERTFQLLTQVAGRAGRGDVPGEVIVQTFTPFHPAVQAARNLDYEGFADQELEFRRELFYPPFCHLVCLHVRGPVEQVVAFSAQAFVKELQKRFGEGVRVSDATPAPLARAKGQFRYQVMLRARSTRVMAGPLRETVKSFKWPERVTFQVDVDAQSIL